MKHQADLITSALHPCNSLETLLDLLRKFLHVDMAGHPKCSSFQEHQQA